MATLASKSLKKAPSADPRAERWAARLQLPVLMAALGAIPSVALHTFYHKGDTGYTVGTVLAWTVWLVFVAEVLIMLAVVSDRRRWIGRHRFDLFIVFVSSPLLTLFLEGLLATRLVGSAARMTKLTKLLKLLKGGKLLKLMKIAKVVKSVKMLKGGWKLTGLRLALVIVPALLVVGAVAESILVKHSNGTKTAAAAWEAAREQPPLLWLMLAAGLLAALRLNSRRLARTQPEPDL